jgi:hypothetical protein
MFGKSRVLMLWRFGAEWQVAEHDHDQPGQEQNNENSRDGEHGQTPSVVGIARYPEWMCGLVMRVFADGPRLCGGVAGRAPECGGDDRADLVVGQVGGVEPAGDSAQGLGKVM